MIRINLLPIKEKKKRKKMVMQVIAISAVLLIAIISTLGASQYYSDRLDARVEALQVLENDIKELRKIIGEVNELKEQRKRLDSQLNAIKSLEKAKSGPVRVLDALSNNIPKRVWLTEIKEKDGAMTFKGVGLNNNVISEFMRAIEKNKYFSAVRLDKVERKKIGGQEVYQFTVICNVNYSA